MRNLIDINILDDGVPRKLLDTANFYKSKGRGLVEGAPLLGQTLAMIFEKPSTRTRISFEVAMTELGGSAIYLDAKSMQMGRGATIADTANGLGRYLDGIMIRASNHETLLQMAKHSNIPVINGLTDLSHPCQTLADIMTFEEKLGSIENKTIALIGDGNNMANSWIHAANVLSFTIRLACPNGRMPDASIIQWARDNDTDIKIDTYRASGAGGQHVNKTESAIRITHIPTGLVVTCQDEKSQHKNRTAAMKVLKSRLLAQEEERLAKERADARKSMVSTGDRSAKIRTYNFPQGRITDHRINFTSYKLDSVMDGQLNEFIEQLKIADQQALLQTE